MAKKFLNSKPNIKVILMVNTYSKCAYEAYQANLTHQIENQQGCIIMFMISVLVMMLLRLMIY